MEFKKQRLYRKVVAIAVLAILLLLLTQLGIDPWLVERYYSQGLYPVVCGILQPLFNMVPFSIGDLLYIILIIALLLVAFRFVSLLFYRQFRDAGKYLVHLLIATQLLILTFYVLWGMNYFRPPAAVRLNLTDTNYTKAELVAVTRILIDSVNAVKTKVAADEANQDSVLLNESLRAVQRLAQKSDKFKTYKPKVKLSLMSLPMSYLGTAGYYNPFTGEAQINRGMPSWLKPLTACHEMAHQMGYSREDEANFVGFLAAHDSRHPMVRYSAYYMAVEEFMFDIMLRDSTSYQDLRQRISAEVLADFKADQQFWQEFRGPAGELSSIFYDNYLRFNNQPEGLRTYNRMIRLTMAWYKQNGISGGKKSSVRSGNYF